MADRPDLGPLDDRNATEHLIRAGRELLAAARSTIDTLDAFLAMLEEREAASRSGGSKVEPIPIRRETS
jgi:hypothetical protein